MRAAGPGWSPSGRELFSRHGDQMAVVAVETGEQLAPGAARELFEGPYDFDMAGSVQESGGRYRVATRTTTWRLMASS